MGYSRTSDERVKEIYNHYIIYGKEDACKEFNLSPHTIDSYIREHKKRFDMEQEKPITGETKEIKNSPKVSKINQEITEDELDILNQYRTIKSVAYGKVEENGESMILTTNVSCSLEDIIKEYGVDTGVWQANSFKPGAWTTPVKAKFESKKDDIRAAIPLIIQNRKSEVTFKKRTSIIDYDQFRKELLEDIKKVSNKVDTISYKRRETGNLLEITIPDLHLGKLAWGEETGGENYDIKIAVNKFNEAFDYLLNESICRHDIGEILFVVGNDLFNSDNAYPYTQTTAGTPQQDDVRWQKVFRIGRNMIINSIDKAKAYAPVKVKVIPGNHDFQKSFYLGEVLEARFHQDDNVEIDNSPRTRKYVRWGNCLLGFAHGNRKDEGEQRLLAAMQNETGSDWSDTIFREWHCGDIHHYKEVVRKSTPQKNGVYKYAEDIDGVVIKYLRTLMFNDEWEARKAYNSQKGAHCFIWNKILGNIAEYKYNG